MNSTPGLTTSASVDVMASRHVGAFLHRCASVAETKAWVGAGERTMTNRYVDGRTATFAKR